MPNYNSLKNKVSKMPDVTTRPMFGYHCYSVSGKFFVGFSSKNDWQVIVRLPKDEQQKAIKANGVEQFSHGAKMGWIQIDMNRLTTDNAVKWAAKGYEHAKILAKK